jgi:ankyrin repeat protein
MCRLLLQCNSDVNATASVDHDPNALGWTRSGCRWTPLHVASYIGHIEVCRLLIASKANVDAKDCSEHTPLQRAIVKDKVAVCQLLLQSNANVEARDSSGWNLMHHAVALGHETVCRLLIASKANVTNDRCIRFLTLTFVW